MLPLRSDALPGVDAEAGYKLPIKGIDFRLFGGGYYFDAAGFDPVSGPKARAEITFNEGNTHFLSHGMELTFGVQYQNDGPRQDTTTALAQIRIPFWQSDNPSKLTPLEKRMTNFVRRDVDIVTGNATIAAFDEAATVELNSSHYTKAVTINSSTPDVQQVLNNAGPNSFVIADGAGIGTGSTFMSGAQALVGGGTTVSITGNTSGKTILGALPGTRGVITNQIDTYFGAGGFTIQNIGINSTTNGIVLGDLSNSYLIDRVDITAAGAGIHTFHSYNGTIKDTVIHSAGAGGLVTTGTSSNLALSNISIENVTGGPALSFNDTITVRFSNIVIGPGIAGTAINLNDGPDIIGNVQLVGGAAGCSLNSNVAGSSISLAGGGTCP